MEVPGPRSQAQHRAKIHPEHTRQPYTRGRQGDCQIWPSPPSLRQQLLYNRRHASLHRDERVPADPGSNCLVVRILFLLSCRRKRKGPLILQAQKQQITHEVSFVYFSRGRSCDCHYKFIDIRRTVTPNLWLGIEAS